MKKPAQTTTTHPCLLAPKLPSGMHEFMDNPGLCHGVTSVRHDAKFRSGPSRMKRPGTLHRRHDIITAMYDNPWDSG